MFMFVAVGLTSLRIAFSLLTIEFMSFPLRVNGDPVWAQAHPRRHENKPSTEGIVKT